MHLFGSGSYGVDVARNRLIRQWEIDHLQPPFGRFLLFVNLDATHLDRCVSIHGPLAGDAVYLA